MIGRCIVQGCFRSRKIEDVCWNHRSIALDRHRSEADRIAREQHRIMQREQKRLKVIAKREAREEAKRVKNNETVAALLSHPSVVRLGELLSLPCYQYDPSEDVQSHIYDCLAAVPTALRRVAFMLPYDQDPFWPVVEPINFERHRPRIGIPVGNGGNHGDGATAAIAWIYGLTRQRIEQVERQAYRKIRSDKALMQAARELNEPAYRFVRGVSGRGENT